MISLRSESAIRFVRFVIVGIAALILKLVLTYVLTAYLGFWYFVSFVIAAGITWTAIFFANAHFTFRDHARDNFLKRYLTFMAGYLATFSLNAPIVLVLTSGLGINYLISIICAAAATSVLTFSFNSRYVYHD